MVVDQLTVVVSKTSTVVLRTDVEWRHLVCVQPAAGSKLSVTAARYLLSPSLSLSAFLRSFWSYRAAGQAETTNQSISQSINCTEHVENKNI